MRKNILFFIIAVCPVFPALSRFSYGIILALEFCLFFLVLLGVRKLISLCDIESDLGIVIEIAVLLLAAALYSGFLKIILSIPSVVLDSFIYTASFSYVIFDKISLYNENAGMSSSYDGYPPILTGFIFLMVFSFLREFFYFGTLSIPVADGIIFMSILPSQALDFTRFWGSFSGSLILTGFVLWLVNYIDVSSNSMPEMT